MKHDIIFNKSGSRAGFWVCKCGKNGRTEQTMNVHKQEIEDEKLLNDVQSERVSNLVQDVLGK